MPDNRIKYLRKTRGLTIEELAERVGVSAGHLSRLENQRRVLSVENAETIGMALAYTTEEVLGFERQEGRPNGGFGEGDLADYAAGPNDPFQRLAGENEYLLTVKSNVLDRAGYHRGDVVVVDGGAEACRNIKPLTPVRAQYHPDPENMLHAVTIFRLFVPPSLLITNSSERNLPMLDLSSDDVQILGVVKSMHRALTA